MDLMTQTALHKDRPRALKRLISVLRSRGIQYEGNLKKGWIIVPVWVHHLQVHLGFRPSAIRRAARRPDLQAAICAAGYIEDGDAIADLIKGAR